VARSAELDRVRALQHALYRAAKADPDRRFHALYDKVLRRDVLERAWDQVRHNRGAAGVDRLTIQHVEQYGIDRLLDKLAASLKDGSYRPLPARRVFIPKPGSTEQRPLSIPAVGDRIVQTALRLVIEPIFEAQFLPCSFGFRPRKAAHDALQVVLDETWRNKYWVAETDVASCFESIPHDRLILAIKERVCDRQVLKLLGALLRAGVLEGGVVRGSVTGTPQGGPLSPLLCNVYLHHLDRRWKPARDGGVLVRYADDAIVVCKSRQQAERALAALTAYLAELGLAPKAAKTRIVHLVVGGEGLEFLGFHHRLVRTWDRRRARHLTFLARWPSRKAMQHARDRIRELTARERLGLPVEQVVQDLNGFLRGWAGYFRYGNSTRQFDKIRTYAVRRLAILVGKRYQRGRRYGWVHVTQHSPNCLGLISLNGRVIAPRANRPWRREGPNALGEGRR
jgi:RNA-directed DNA polymerase